MKSSLPRNWEVFNSQHAEIEKNISQRKGSYQGLGPEALYTSIKDLETIFRHELVTGSFLDLGCGQGLTALYYGDLFPERKSSGIEFEKARVESGKKFQQEHQLTNVNLIEADLLKVKIPEADTYLLYFPTGHVLDRILSELYQSYRPFMLIAIESHGDLYHRLELENWLELKAEIPLTSQRHNPMSQIYQRTYAKREESLLPFTLSYQEFHIQISDQSGDWIGETFGMEWADNDRFELLTPPRTIYWKNVKKMMVTSDLDEQMKLAVQIRREGEVTITTNKASYQGIIRKIVVEPVFRLEISSGEQVEWSEILTITRGSHLCYESF